MVKDPRAQRHDRLRNALRENLKRRKAQSKARAALPESPVEGAPRDHEKSTRAIRATGTKGAS